MCALEKYSKDILSDERWLMRALFISFLNLSLQFSCSVVSDSLRPRGLQHARPPCPSSTPSLLKLMFIESVMPSNRLILFIYTCHQIWELRVVIHRIFFFFFTQFSNSESLHSFALKVMILRPSQKKKKKCAHLTKFLSHCLA